MIRSEEESDRRPDAAGWIHTGVERVILGTLAIRDPESIKTLAAEYGSHHVMVSVDARGGRVAIEGWQELAGDYIEYARLFEEMGAGSLLYTNVDVEGLQQGIALEPIRKLITKTRLPLTVAGGISGRDDLMNSFENRCVRGCPRLGPVQWKNPASARH